MPPAHVSPWILITHKTDAQRGFFSLKIHRHSKFMEGALTEYHVLAIAAKLARHSLWAGLQTSSMWCSFHSHPLGHVHLIKLFHVLHLIFPIHEQNVSPVPPTALSTAKAAEDRDDLPHPTPKPLSLDLTFTYLPKPCLTFWEGILQEELLVHSQKWTQTSVFPTFSYHSIQISVFVTHKPVIPEGNCSIWNKQNFCLLKVYFITGKPLKFVLCPKEQSCS